MALSLPKTPLSETFAVSVFFGWAHSMGIFLCLGFLGQRYMHKYYTAYRLHVPMKHEALLRHYKNCLHIPPNESRAVRS